MPFICRYKKHLISVTTFPEIKPQIFIDFDRKTNFDKNRFYGMKNVGQSLTVTPLKKRVIIIKLSDDTSCTSSKLVI